MYANCVKLIRVRTAIMIEVTLKPRRKRARLAFWQPRRPRVLAIFAFRYDAHLVPALIENIGPMVDGWVALDDRDNPAPISDDTTRRHALLEAAHAAGARWILAVDPDERFEAGVADHMDTLTAELGHFVWAFNLREMYTPTTYRVDGVWGRKRQRRLFPIFDDLFPIADKYGFPRQPFHGQWVPPWYAVRSTDHNIYHLKMIAETRRKARADLYNALDPDGALQKIGYDYLSDETGAAFQTIAAGREYHPAHEDDGGLWMPAARDVGRAV